MIANRRQFVSPLTCGFRVLPLLPLQQNFSSKTFAFSRGTCLASVTSISQSGLFLEQLHIYCIKSLSEQAAKDIVILSKDEINHLKSNPLHLPFHHHLMHFLPIFAIIVRSHFWIQFLERNPCHIHSTPHGHCRERINSFLFPTLFKKKSFLCSDFTCEAGDWNFSSENCLQHTGPQKADICLQWPHI